MAVSQSPVCPSQGLSLPRGFSFLLYSHVINHPNSKAEKINYMVDKFMQDTVTPPQHQLVLKRWESHSAACRQVFSQTGALPDSQDVPPPTPPPSSETTQAGQTLLPVLLDLSDLGGGSGRMLEGDRDGWVIERVSKDTWGPGGKSRNTANWAETHPRQPELGCSRVQWEGPVARRVTAGLHPSRR